MWTEHIFVIWSCIRIKFHISRTGLSPIFLLTVPRRFLCHSSYLSLISPSSGASEKAVFRGSGISWVSSLLLCHMITQGITKLFLTFDCTQLTPLN